MEKGLKEISEIERSKKSLVDPKLIKLDIKPELLLPQSSSYLRGLRHSIAFGEIPQDEIDKRRQSIIQLKLSTRD